VEQVEERDAYLLRGRRVLISDLIKADLLQPGTDLVFERPRLGSIYDAKVTEDAKLQLADGRSFASPSRAAVVATGGSIDGWHAWQIAPNGEFLNTLRQRLLDQVAGLERSRLNESDEFGAWRSHYEFLQNAKHQAEAGMPIELRVRNLLAQWDATGRSQTASEQIAADLENHGLTTEPPFLKTGIDSVVKVVERQLETKERVEGEGAADLESDTDVGLTLGNIPSANCGVESVTPQATYEEAITVMLLNDFSQLAVMTGARSTPRAVTWQSIARERHAHPDGQLGGAIIDATTLRFDTELVDVLPVLESQDFVFVKDATNVIKGIVTTADVVRAYGQLATPFFLIGELDKLLRRVITDGFTLEEIRKSCDSDGTRGLQSYDELTMGDYQRMLEDPSNWATLEWPLDRAVFTRRLSDLREVRNDLMHFNPDPISEQAVILIRSMIQLIRKYS